MAKLMAPNIRIDWYPEGHFDDPSNPTLEELNSGYNLSRAIVTGYTLDFTDPTTEEYSGVLSDFTVQVYSRVGYEANLQFFLAPRESAEDNERAFRHAEELFYNPNQSVGYLVKRFGYLCHVDYGDIEEQRIDIFKVQADLPKVLSEDGEPILLDIRFIPQGFAASAVIAPWLPPSDSYVWEGTPGYSMSLYYDKNSNITKRNIIPNPSFEYNNTSFLSSPNVTIGRANQGFFGAKALGLTVLQEPSSSEPQQFFISLDAGVAQGKWIGFSYAVKSSVEGIIETQVLDLHPQIIKSFSAEYRHVRSGAIYIPEGTVSLGIRNYLYSNVGGRRGVLPLGAKIYFDGLQTVVGDSEEHVLQQLETYFDGNGEYTQLPPEASQDFTRDTYLWDTEPGISDSLYLDSSGQITKRNIYPDPSFEYGDTSNLDTNYSSFSYRIVNSNALYGNKALEATVTGPGTELTAQQIQFDLNNLESAAGQWIGYSFNAKSDAIVHCKSDLFLDSSRRLREDRLLDSEYRNIQSGAVFVPEGTESIRLILFNKGKWELPIPSGEKIYIDGINIVVGDSAESVQHQLEAYFDGNGEHALPEVAREYAPGELPFSWEGEPNFSPSILEDDGEVVARNLVLNPSFENSTDYQKGWVIESNFNANDLDIYFSSIGSVVGDRYLSIQIFNNRVEGDYLTLKFADDALVEIPSNDKWIVGRFNWYTRAQLRVGDNKLTAQVELLDSNKNVVSTFTVIDSNDFPSKGEPYTWAVPNLVGAEYLQLKVTFHRPTVNTTRSYLDIDAFQIASGKTFEEAAEQVKYYFDGGAILTNPVIELTKPSTQYAWLGEPHNSPSVKMVDGEVVARNLFSNPSFELGLEGVEHSGNASLTHVGGLAVATGDYGMQVSINNASINAGWVRQVAPASSDDWGKWVGWSAVVRNSISVLSLRWYYEVRQGTSVLSSGYMGNFPVDWSPLPDAPRHSFAVQVDHGADEIRFWLRPTKALSSARYFTDDWVGVLADSEQEALDQAATYFDGDTPDEYL